MIKNTAIIIGELDSISFGLEDIFTSNNIVTIAETADGYLGIQLIRELSPKLVFFDLELSEGCCMKIVESIRNMGMQCVIIILSSKGNLLYARKCIDIGANAIVSKDSAVEHIVTAINAAINGFVFYPFKTSNFKLGTNIPNSDSDSDSEIKLDKLSLQETKVFKNLLKGSKTSSIAFEMNISDKTVSTYKQRVMKKLGCKSLTELYLFASKNNLTI